MPVWRNARQRRLYGKPDDPIEPNPSAVASNSRSAGSHGSTSGPYSSSNSAAAENRSGDTRGAENSSAPVPKRVKREKTRPESEYELIHGFPVTESPPDYSLLTSPAEPGQYASVVQYAIHASRQNWLAGPMLETFWTRKPKGKKSTAEGQVNLREKMTKLHECSVTFGPHTFPVKLFTVRDDNVGLDEEADKKVEEILEAKRKAADDTEAPKTSFEGPVDVDSTDKPDQPLQGVRSRDGQKEDSPANVGNTANENAVTGVKEGSKDDSKPVTDETSSSHEMRPETTAPEQDRGVAGEPKLEQSPLKGEDTASVTEKMAEPSSPSLAGPPPAKKAKRSRKPKPAKPPQAVENLEGAAIPSGVPTAENQSSAAHKTSGFVSEKETIEAQKRRNEELEQKLNAPRAPENETHLSAPATEATTIATPDRAPESEPVPGVSTGPSSTPSPGPATAPSQPNSQMHTPSSPQVSPEATSQAQPQTAPQASIQAAPQVPTQAPPSVAPAGPLPPGDDAVKAPPPNQLVVYRLQQMAARDPSLSDLMRLVASGTASPDSIAKFQEIINRVKASIATSPLVIQQHQQTPRHPTQAHPNKYDSNQTGPGSVKQGPQKKATATYSKPKVVRQTLPYHPRPNAKAIMLAIEFDESPSERYLLPKRSIIEFVPEKEEVLWSFLHVTNPNEGKSKSQKNVTKTRAIYTPVTAVFHQISPRIAQTLERCVRRPEVVRYYMEETMRDADRAQPWNIWFQIEKNDEVLADLIRKLPVPMMPPPAPPRKPLKPRKPRGPSAHQQQQEQFLQQQQQYHAYMMWLAKVKRGQPLHVPQMMLQRPGEPFILPPSFMTRQAVGMPQMFRPVLVDGSVSGGNVVFSGTAPIGMMGPPLDRVNPVGFHPNGPTGIDPSKAYTHPHGVPVATMGQSAPQTATQFISDNTPQSGFPTVNSTTNGSTLSSNSEAIPSDRAGLLSDDVVTVAGNENDAVNSDQSNKFADIKAEDT